MMAARRVEWMGGGMLAIKGDAKPMQSVALRLWPDEIEPEIWHWNRCGDGPTCDAYGCWFVRRVSCTEPIPPPRSGPVWPSLHPKHWDLDELLGQLGVSSVEEPQP